jgi:hypothetical protein
MTIQSLPLNSYSDVQGWILWGRSKTKNIKSSTKKRLSPDSIGLLK